MAKKKAGAAVTPEAAADAPAAPAAPEQAPAKAAPAQAPAAVHISDARKAQLRAMLGPDGKLLPDHEEAMRERGITPEEVHAAINGTARRYV